MPTSPMNFIFISLIIYFLTQTLIKSSSQKESCFANENQEKTQPNLEPRLKTHKVL